MCRRAPCTSARLGQFSLLIGLVVVAGCGGGSGTNPVNGSVTIDGKPTGGVMLILCPVGGSPEFQKVRPSGVTKEDGTFALNTRGNNDGAPAGQYKVLLTWASQSTGPSRDGTMQMGPDRLQGRYNNLEKSPFSVEVKSGTNTLPPFELKSK